MKKYFITAAVLSVLLTFTACSNETDSSSDITESVSSSVESASESSDINSDKSNISSETAPETSGENSEKSNDNNSKILVAYFSNPQTDNTDANASASRVYLNDKLVGNTQYAAQIIKDHTDGELFEIKPENAYPAAYEDTVKQASEEQSQGTHPKLANHIDNINDYDVIFIGYPTWWSDMPMAVYSFFDEYDLKGKTIIPFNTHGGSGLSSTVDTIKQLEPDSTVMDGYSIFNSEVENSKSEIEKWINGLDI